MSQPITDLIHHPYVPPAGFAAPQPGVFKASTVIFPNVAAMRARDWKNKTRLHLRPARHADHLHAGRAHRGAGRRQALHPGAQRAGGHRQRQHGLAQGRRRSPASRQRLRPQQGAGRRRVEELGHLAPALRPDEPGRPARAHRPADAAGLARGAGIGHPGVSRRWRNWPRSAASAASSRPSTTPGAPASRSTASTSARARAA